MADIATELAAARLAVDEMVRAIEAEGTKWDEPPAPGKWSPSQIVEHLARGLEEGSRNASGERFARLPHFPIPMRFLARNLFFKRVLRTGRFPKGKANPEMDPEVGPETVEAGRERLERAWVAFERTTMELAAIAHTTKSPVFGSVPVVDLVRFITLHVLHHTKQIPVV